MEIFLRTWLTLCFFPEHTLSNNEILLCDAIQSELNVNTMISTDRNIAGCKPANGAGMAIIKHGFQKNELTLYTGCHRRKGPNFGRVFLMLNYTDITQNTYIQS